MTVTPARVAEAIGNWVPERGAFRPCAGFFLRMADKAGRLRPPRWANGHKDCPCRHCQMADVTERVKSVRDRWWRLAEYDTPPDALHVSFDLPPALRARVTAARQGAFKALCAKAVRRAWAQLGVEEVNGVAYFHPAGPSLQRMLAKAGISDPMALPTGDLADYDRYHPHVHVLVPMMSGAAMGDLTPPRSERDPVKARQVARSHQQVFRRILTQEYRRALARFCQIKRTELPFVKPVFLKVYAGAISVKKFLTFALPEELRGFPGWPTRSHLSTFGPWRSLRGHDGEGLVASPEVPAAAVAYETLVAAGTFDKLPEEEQAVVRSQYEADMAAEAVLGHGNGTTAPSARPSDLTGSVIQVATPPQAAPWDNVSYGAGRWAVSLNLGGITLRDPVESHLSRSIRGYIEREDRKLVATFRRLTDKLTLVRADPRVEARRVLEVASADLGVLVREVRYCAERAPSRRRAASYLVSALRGDAGVLDESPPFGLCGLLTLRELAQVFRMLRETEAAPSACTEAA